MTDQPVDREAPGLRRSPLYWAGAVALLAIGFVLHSIGGLVWATVSIGIWLTILVRGPEWMRLWTMTIAAAVLATGALVLLLAAL